MDDERGDVIGVHHGHTGHVQAQVVVPCHLQPALQEGVQEGVGDAQLGVVEVGEGQTHLTAEGLDGHTMLGGDLQRLTGQSGGQGGGRRGGRHGQTGRYRAAGARCKPFWRQLSMRAGGPGGTLRP